MPWRIGLAAPALGVPCAIGGPGQTVAALETRQWHIQIPTQPFFGQLAHRGLDKAYQLYWLVKMPDGITLEPLRNNVRPWTPPGP